MLHAVGYYAGQVLLAIGPNSPAGICINTERKDIRHAVAQAFGGSAGFMACQGLVISGKSVLALRSWTIIAASTVLGGAITAYATQTQRETLYKLINLANLIMGALSLYNGYYVFAALAFLTSGGSVFDGDNEPFIRYLQN